jgi:glycosyltransferase involved in cell wall biosynthesis
MTMRVCLIATEYQGIDSFGGFGVGTRQIAEGLAGRGIETFVAMPRKRGQRPIEHLGDVTIISYPSSRYIGLMRARPFAAIYRMIDADVYHSQEPTLGTRLAQIGAPRKKHVVTIRDPRTLDDWRKQWSPVTHSRFRELAFLWRYQRGVGTAVRSADAVCCKARSVMEKSRALFRLKSLPQFLPDPIWIPEREPRKPRRPTVCFLGRWDPVKQPELFFSLAARFPEVRFIAAGACLNDAQRDRHLREKASRLPNIELPGWVDSSSKAEVLTKSWILINTSTKECLPISYLEACAYRCAILSHCNTDDFASEYGHWARTGDLDDFRGGLAALLDNNLWRDRGQRGYRYVSEFYGFDEAIDRHVRLYQDMVNSPE